MATPYFGPNYSDFKLHFMLVGKFRLTSALRKELLAAIENSPIQLELHMANDLSVLNENGCDLSFDFICLCLDIKTSGAVAGDTDFLKSQLNQLDKHYLLASKVSLVVAWNNLAPGHLEICNKLSRFAITHKVTLVRGDMDNPKISSNVAARVIELAVAANGVRSAFGVPIYFNPTEKPSESQSSPI